LTVCDRDGLAAQEVGLFEDLAPDGMEGRRLDTVDTDLLKARLKLVNCGAIECAAEDPVRRYAPRDELANTSDEDRCLATDLCRLDSDEQRTGARAG
jgi:hypothetical protein